MKGLLFHKAIHKSCCGFKPMVSAFRRYSQFASIRERLEQCRAGSVDLSKDCDTGVAVLTLNNPESKNALSGSMMVDLANHVTELDQWKEGRGVILRGAGNTFCAGGDLKTIMTEDDQQFADYMSRLMHDTMTRLRSLPLVSMALIEGVAIGGGAELAVACDVRAMAENAKLGFVQMKMGLSTGWGGATHLLHLVGRSKALRMLLSGEMLGAARAVDMGLVEHALPPSPPCPLSSATHTLTHTYCSGDVGVGRGVKRMVEGIGGSGSVREGLRVERETFVPLWKGEAHLAALSKNIKHKS